MRLPIFLLGFLVAVVASMALGLAAGFDSGALALFVLAVVVIVQLAYVGLVALLAAERKQSSSQSGLSTPKAPSTRVSPENDV
ncbi:hypothetical protein [Roseobacter weihaiensis]|uniref:hypothetical protein n=1 Tax=Roseobacter weihaiensis TaxID=2763262 RepID=UPI001D0BD221|nr:hypothetical protein [Roseobacter sp. H9]